MTRGSGVLHIGVLVLLIVATGCRATDSHPAQATNESLDTVFFTFTGNPQPICPDAATLLPTDQSDQSHLQSLVPQMVRQLYTGPGSEEYSNVDVAQAADAGLHGQMVETWCGPEVAKSTWVVKLRFPKNAPSASMSAGQFMVAKTRKGWQVWYQYH